MLKNVTLLRKELSANWAFDADKILLDISNVTIQHNKTKGTPQNTVVTEHVIMAGH